MSSTLPPQDPAHPQEPVSSEAPVGGPQEPGRSRRRADRPTAPAAARASVRATGRAIGLLATEPRRRRAQRRARVALGRAVAATWPAGRPRRSWPTRWPPTARPSSASPPPTRHPVPVPSRPPGPDRSARRGRGGGRVQGARARVASRASRSAGRHRDLAAELECLLLIVVQFLPRLAARVRLRVADERLGAWATGLSDLQDPTVAAARERAAEAQRAAASARVAASANWRQAADAARLAVRLVSEAVADLIFWVGHGIRSGSSMVFAWLVSLGVAGRRRVRHGSVTAGRHVRAGSTATRDSLRVGLDRDPRGPQGRVGRGRPGHARRGSRGQGRRCRPRRGGRRARLTDRRPGRARPPGPRRQRGHHRPARRPPARPRTST